MVVKELKKDNYTLVHSVIEGTFGQPVNFFELIRDEKNGDRTHFPILPPIKVRNYTKDSPIFYLETYTEEEYENIMQKELCK